VFVTDTHAFGQYAQLSHSKLGREARRLFQQADEGSLVIYVPTIALWEILILSRLGRVNLPIRFDHWCRGLANKRGFVIEPLDWTDVNEARQLPFADPYDCLIAGTALRLGIPLITKDQAIVDSGLVETVW
jgi:PIN domain nuclease of toxin-antitoxin system